MMNKKLLAAAVAGALALPGVALAQSSVTISGLFKMSTGNYKIANPAAARVGNTSENHMTDDSSRIVFNVVEDLGGGLQAIGQFDWRVAIDNGVDGGGPQGNNHIGLRSKSWGRILIGRQDLHYFNIESLQPTKTDLKAVSWSLLSFTQNGAAGAQAAIANTSRTPNVIHYTTPDWGGFTLIAAYAFNAAAQEADIGAVARKGRTIHLNPNLQGSNYQIGYSYFNAKFDALAAPDQRSDRLYGSYTWGGLKVGLVWDKSRLNAAATGLKTNERTAWSIPVSYLMGPHNFYGHYTKARDDKITVAQDGAKMLTLAYAYDLSKRTSLGLTYSKITNDVGASYNMFVINSGAIGVGGAVLTNMGEDPRLMTVTVRHVF